MSALFRLSGAVRRNPAVEAWFSGPARLDRGADALFPEPADALRRLARAWFERLRECGPDVEDPVPVLVLTAASQEVTVARDRLKRLHRTEMVSLRTPVDLFSVLPDGLDVTDGVGGT